ncbi:MAG: glycoside hydrolase family 68 protein [Gammaproteobacteria bacterium]|jgi:beta-fructofuranosidase
MHRLFGYLVPFLFFCSLVSPATAAYPPGVYAVEGQYIWDSWIVEDQGVLHRYALSAPKEGYTPNERHEHAFVRHAVSNDGGVTWKDLGPAVTPQPKGTWPDHVVWTSSVMLHKNEQGEKEFLMFITGRSEEDDLTQRIGLARSTDGHHFSVPTVILSPTETLGYDITDDDGIIMAWRDPYLIQDPADGRWHMVFSAKSKDSCGVIRPTVGHAVAEDASFTSWSLQPPMTLPQYYRQVEVPYMLHRDGKYYLFVSTQANPLVDNNAGKEAAFRGYEGDSITGPWTLVYEDTDRIYGHQIYAPTLFEKRRGSGEYAAVSFYSLDTGCPLTGTPVVDIRWEEGDPHFEFNEDLGPCLTQPPSSGAKEAQP